MPHAFCLQKDFLMMKWSFPRGFLLALFGLGLVFPAFAEAPAVKGRTILVFDASGSMWGQIDGVNKITIAREVVGDLMQDWDEDIHLGLIAYGHRHKGECTDIQTLVPVGAGTAKKVAAQVKSINPKGMTPLSASVKKAAEELKYTEEPATVILITDGEETCNVDPCALGKELSESGVDFTAHVVAFDMKGLDLKPLQCLAESTGGEFLMADDAGALKSALGTVAKAVSTGGGDRAYAIVDDDGTRFKGDVYWHVFAADAQGKATGAHLHYGVGPSFLLKQPAGKYVVRGKTRSNEVSAEMLVEVLEDETREHVLDMRSGTVVLRATINGEPGKRGQYWDLYWYAHPILPDGSIGGRVATRVTDNTVEDKANRMRLPPGTYHIDAFFRTPSLGRQVTQVTITAGQESEVMVNFEAAKKAE